MVYQLEPIEDEDLNSKEKSEPIKEKTIKTEVPSGNAPAETKPEKEATQEISSAEKDDTYSKILSKVKTVPAKDADDQEIAKDAAATSQKTDAESQIQHLVDLAMQKGLFHAVKVAQHMQDNYVLDMFHDKLLSEELHAALVQKGLIKEE
jgi:hypothetical protein